MPSVFSRKTTKSTSFAPRPLSGTRRSLERADRADVRVEVEAEAQAEEDVARVLERRDARIAERAEEHGARLARDALAHLRGVGGAVPQVAIGAEIELPEVERQAARVPVELENARGLGDDLGADAVARDDGDEPGRSAHLRLLH